MEQVYGIYDRQGQLLQAPGAPGPSISQIPGLMKVVGELSDAELTLMASALPSLEELHRGAAQLLTVATADRERAAAAGHASGPGLVGGGPATANGSDGSFPVAQYGCPGGRPSYGGTVASLVVVVAAQGVQATASRICEQDAFGFNTSLVCLIPDSILIIAESVYEGVNLCTGDADSAEILASYERNDFLRSQSEAILSVVNDISDAIASGGGTGGGGGGGNGDVLNAIANVQTFLDGFSTNVITGINIVNNNLTVARNSILERIDSRYISHQTDINGARAAIISELQSQVSGVVVPRLDAIEAALEGGSSPQRITLDVLNIDGGDLYLVVATQAGVGEVDVTFDAFEGFEPKSRTFNSIPGAIVAVETGVYTVFLPNGTFENPIRLQCRRELGAAGPEDDILGSVYFHKDALNSGGQ